MNERNKNKNEGGNEYTIEAPGFFKPEFSNSVRMNVSNDSVSFQFAYFRPGDKKGFLVSEVILTPRHAIQFQKSLADTLKKHYTKDMEE